MLESAMIGQNFSLVEKTTETYIFTKNYRKTCTCHDQVKFSNPFLQKEVMFSLASILCFTGTEISSFASQSPQTPQLHHMLL